MQILHLRGDLCDEHSDYIVITHPKQTDGWNLPTYIYIYPIIDTSSISLPAAVQIDAPLKSGAALGDFEVPTGPPAHDAIILHIPEP